MKINRNQIPVGHKMINKTSWILLITFLFTLSLSAQSGPDTTNSNNSTLGTELLNSAGNAGEEIKAGGDPYITVTPTSASVSYISGSTKIIVASNTSWTVSESSSWLSLSTTSGSGSGSFTIYRTANSSTSSRSASVSVMIGEIGQSVTINQSGVPIQIPTAPDIVTATPLSAGSIQVSWSGASGTIDGYKIYRSATQTGGYSLLGIVDGSTSSYTNSSLNPNTTYYYQVSAYNQSGESPINQGIWASATTYPAIPTPPDIITATALSSESIQVSWSGASGLINGYRIYRSATQTGGYSLIGLVSGSTSSYTNSGLNPNTTYYYQVSAYNQSGESPINLGIWASATTLPLKSADEIGEENSTGKAGGDIRGGGGTLSVSPSSVSANSSSGSTSISVTADMSWTVSESASWLSLSTSSGSGNGSFTIYRTTNTSTSSRSATVTVENIQLGFTATVTVTQAGTPYVNVSPTSASVSYSSGSTTINVSSNTNWTVSESSSWLSLSTTSGSGSGSFTIYRTANSSTSSRSASVGISIGEIGQSVTINQSGAPNQTPTATINSISPDPAASGASVSFSGSGNDPDGGSIAAYQWESDINGLLSTSASFSTSSLAATTHVIGLRVQDDEGTWSSWVYDGLEVIPLPSTPSGVSAVANGQSSITVTWNNVSNETGYYIYRATSSTGTYSQVGSVSANITSYTNTGLSAGTTYYYKVRAYNSVGTSGYSSYGYATTAPSTPGSVSASVNSQTSITVSWGNVSNETAYYIYRASSSTGTYSQVGSVGANVTSYTNTGLSAGTTYYYKVRAYNSGGYSGYSNYASATTLPNPPSAPGEVLAGANSQTSVTVSWTNVSNETGYYIYRATSSTGTYSQVGSTGANVLSYTNTGLSAGTSYYYKVKAYNSGGTSGYSSYASVTTLPDPPAVPGSVSASANSLSSITVTWGNVSNETAYYIYRATSSTGTYSQVGSVSANVTSYTNTGLSASTTYYYKVRAYNTGGYSGYSSYASATTYPAIPQLPDIVSATTQSNSSISVSWGGASGTISGYKIYRSTTQSGGYSQITSVSSSTSNYTDSGLNPSTTYYYQVSAYNQSGESSINIGIWAAATTLPDPPSTPTGVSASANSQSSITVSWGNVSNETAYYIYRATSSTGTYSQVGSVSANVTSYINTGLSASTTYYYKVRAYNSGGYSGYSSYASATTDPAIPQLPDIVTASTLSDESIQVSWGGASGVIDGYKIYRSLTQSGGYSHVGSVGSLSSAYTDTDLLSGTQYYYQVSAYNVTGDSPIDIGIWARAITLPATPNGITATADDPTSITISWNNVTGETDYYIYRAISATGTYSQVGSTAADETSFQDDNLDENTTYYYKVRAYNAGGYSGYSSYASATTPPAIPALPDIVSATTQSNTSISLYWGGASGTIDGYKIYRSLTESGGYSHVGSVIGSSASNFLDTGLVASTTYYYQVSAYNVTGDSPIDQGIWAQATTYPNPPDTPTSITAVASEESIVVSWSGNVTDPEGGYRIYSSMTEEGEFTLTQTIIPGVFAYTFICEQNTTYYYKVSAFNTGGESALSAIVSATTHPEIPQLPDIVTATTLTNSSIKVYWGGASGTIDGYHIHRSLSQSEGYSEIAEVIGSTESEFIDTGLDAGTKYYYQVSAYNVIGDSPIDQGIWASATTLPNAPSTPGGVSTSSNGPTSIIISWNDVSDETGYNIYRSTDAGVTSSIVGNPVADETSFTDTELTPETTYYYAVSSNNTGGESPLSAFIPGTTDPAIPQGPSTVSASTLSGSSIQVSWSGASGTIEGYKIYRSLTESGGYTEIDDNISNALSNYNDINLDEGTTYYYQVSASNVTGDSPIDQGVWGSATTIPVTPTGLSVSSDTPTSTSLTWNDVSGETGYKIYRSVDAGATSSTVGTPNEDATSFTDTDLTPETIYYYAISSTNSGGESELSSYISVTTKPAIPQLPDNVSAFTVSNSSIRIIWSGASGTIDGYHIHRSLSQSAGYSVVGTVIGSTESEFIDTELDANTTYYYQVSAYNVTGDSPIDQGIWTSQTTYPDPPVYPDMVSAITVSNTSIRVTWGGATGTIDEYNIYRSTTTFNEKVLAATVNSLADEYFDTELNASTTYYYWVSASNQGGESDLVENLYGVTTTAPNPPEPPTVISLSPLSNTSIYLSWSGATGVIDGYNIYRTTAQLGDYTLIGSTPNIELEYTDTELEPYTQYFYSIAAYNQGGESLESEAFSAFTKSNPFAEIVSISPVQPSASNQITLTGRGIDLDGLAAGTSLTFKWTIDNTTILSGSSATESTTLSEGNHIIALEVQDDEGNWSEAYENEIYVAPIQSIVGQNWHSIATEYDLLGNVTKQTIDNAHILRNSYDEQGRLENVYSQAENEFSEKTEAEYSYFNDDRIQNIKLAQPDDLLINGGFEAATGWSSGQSFDINERSDEEVFEGDYSWHLKTTGQNGMTLESTSISFEADKYYYLSGYIYLKSGAVSLQRFPVLDTYFIDHISEQNTWYKHGSLIKLDNAANYSIWVQVLDPAGIGGEAYLDNFSVQPVNSISVSKNNLISDGNMEFEDTWTAYGLPTETVKSSENALSGYQSVKIVTNETEGGGITSPSFYVEKGKLYKVECSSFSTSGYGTLISETGKLNIDMWFNATSAWQSKSIIIEATADGTEQLIFYGDPSSEIFVDDISVKEVEISLEESMETAITYNYNSVRPWLESIDFNNSKFHEDLGYEDNGNIDYQKIINGGGQGWPSLEFTYGYDNYNRLQTMTEAASQYSASYIYDGNGNFTQKSNDLETQNFTYVSGTNRVDHYVSDDYYGFGYDPKGNVTIDHRIGMSGSTYNHLNLPTSMTIGVIPVTYRYNDAGQRIEKKNGSSEDNYLYDQLGRQLAVFDEYGQIKMINIHGNGLVGRIEPERTEFERYYYIKDHLGSIRQTVNEAGRVVSAQDYYPYGAELRSVNYASADEKYKFTEKERDNESTYDYFGARYYNSTIGRWLQVDPLDVKYPGLSPFNYTLNSPMNNFDPNGKFVVDHRNGRVFATRYTVAEGGLMTIAEFTPIGIFSVAGREYRGDPSYTPTKLDWISSSLGVVTWGGSKAIGTTITKGAKAYKYTDRAVSGISTSPFLFVAGEQFDALNMDAMIFSEATKLTVKYNGKRYKLASYAQKRTFLEGQGMYVGGGIDESEIVMNPALYNVIKENGEDPEAFFNDSLNSIGEPESTEGQDYWSNYDPQYQ